jgi:hypothetical protein
MVMIHLKDRKDYLLVILALGLTVLFIFLAIYFTFSEMGRREEPELQPQPQSEAKTRPNINYAPNSLGKAHVKLTSRIPLSPSDVSAKNNLIAASENGIINETSQYSIEYISAFDHMEVTLLTTSIDEAKTQAETYLKNAGLSQNGLCNLPVIFSVEYSVRKKLPDNTVFNPLPNGC